MPQALERHAWHHDSSIHQYSQSFPLTGLYVCKYSGPIRLRANGTLKPMRIFAIPCRSRRLTLHNTSDLILVIIRVPRTTSRPRLDIARAQSRSSLQFFSCIHWAFPVSELLNQMIVGQFELIFTPRTDSEPD